MKVRLLVLPRLAARLAVVAALVVLAAPASAQLLPAPATADAAATAAPSATAATAAAPSATAPASGEAPPRPPPGPALRERNARRGRGNPAGGALMLVLLVAVLVYGVAKWIKRRL